MEYFSSSAGFEAPLPPSETGREKDGDKKTDKKKSKESLYGPDKRHDDAKKIAESLNKSSLFEGLKLEKGDESKPEKEPELKHLRAEAPADEETAPADMLGETEKLEITQELAAARRTELAGQPVAVEAEEIDPETATAEQAAEAFLEQVEASGDMDAAYQEVVDEFDLPEATEEESEVAMTDERPLELTEGEITLGPPEMPEPTDDETGTTGAGGTGGTANGGTGGGRGSGGGATPPPPPAGHGPVPPYGGRGPIPPFTSAAGGGAIPTSARFNMLPPTSDVVPLAEAADWERQAQARGLLVGGIIGYLIGRRRGRIKTEKRLRPVQKRLEKQVKNIQEQLYDREAEVRRLAAVQARLKRPAAATERQHLDRAAPASAARPESQRGVAVPERARAVRQETRLGLSKPSRAERLGKVVVGAETALPVAAELRHIKPEQVKMMSRQEVLGMGEKVAVKGTNLRQMYERHLIGEQGLRRVVMEYLRGRDVQQALQHELVEREIDFERDPQLRDKAYHELQQAGGGAALPQLLRQAGITATDDQLAEVAARLQYADQAAASKQPTRRIVDTAMATIIAVLLAIVIYLVLHQ